MNVRVLGVAQDYWPFLQRGGRPWKVAAIAKELVQRGDDVTILTADLGLDPALGATRRRWGFELDHDGARACYLRVAWSWRAATLSPDLLSFCKAEVSRHDVAHIYGIYDLYGPAVAWACHRAKVPYVVEPMGMFPVIVRSRWKKRAYHAVLGAPLIAGAARIVATAERERDELVAGGVDPGKIVVRRNGIDLAPFQSLPARGAFRTELGFTRDHFVLLFLGRISQKKGLDLLIRAMPSLPSHVVLAIVGPDDGDGSLAGLAREVARLGLQARIRLLGPRYDAAKIAALVDADLFVLPSQNENFGNAVIEAIACGVPALVTRECGVAPLIEGRAGVAVAYDERAIADGLRALVQDREALSAMRAAGPAIARELSWQGPVDETRALYLQVAEETRALRRPSS